MLAVAELLVDHALHEALGLGVAELGLGLTFELRLRKLDADDRGQHRRSAPETPCGDHGAEEVHHHDVGQLEAALFVGCRLERRPGIGDASGDQVQQEQARARARAMVERVAATTPPISGGSSTTRRSTCSTR